MTRTESLRVAAGLLRCCRVGQGHLFQSFESVLTLFFLYLFYFLHRYGVKKEKWASTHFHFSYFTSIAGFYLHVKENPHSHTVQIGGSVPLLRRDGLKRPKDPRARGAKPSSTDERRGSASTWCPTNHRCSISTRACADHHRSTVQG